MRIISGKVKGHKLLSPVGLDVRPTLDRVKESIFSILYPYLKDAKVLDLFAGAGSLGLEALSRGAKVCHFVDNNRKSYDCVVRNIKDTRFENESVCHFMSFDKFLTSTKEKFTLVFLDPPYSKGFEDKVFEKISPVLEKGAVVMLETEYEAKEYEGFETIRRAKYGRVYITIYKRGESL